MARLLFDLRNVPDDEAEEVRALLASHGIRFHETRPSAFGVLAGGLWVADRELEAIAGPVLAAYQAQRRERARADYAQARASGRAEGFWVHLRREPGKVLVLLGTILALIALTLLPFLLLGDPRRGP